MIKHHITKFRSDGIRYAASWIQVNIFGKVFCFSYKKVAI